MAFQAKARSNACREARGQPVNI